MVAFVLDWNEPRVRTRAPIGVRILRNVLFDKPSSEWGSEWRVALSKMAEERSCQTFDHSNRRLLGPFSILFIFKETCQCGISSDSQHFISYNFPHLFSVHAHCSERNKEDIRELG